MNQEQLDAIYLQQLSDFERDRQFERVVTFLQGLAAITVIIAFIYQIRSK